jgi:hypothetical protein
MNGTGTFAGGLCTSQYSNQFSVHVIATGSGSLSFTMTGTGSGSWTFTCPGREIRWTILTNFDIVLMLLVSWLK